MKFKIQNWKFGELHETSPTRKPFSGVRVFEFFACEVHDSTFVCWAKICKRICTMRWLWLVLVLLHTLFLNHSIKVPFVFSLGKCQALIKNWIHIYIIFLLFFWLHWLYVVKLRVAFCYLFSLSTYIDQKQIIIKVFHPLESQES